MLRNLRSVAMISMAMVIPVLRVRPWPIDVVMDESSSSDDLIENSSDFVSRMSPTTSILNAGTADGIFSELSQDDADLLDEWDQLMLQDIKGGIGIEPVDDGSVTALKPGSAFDYWPKGIIYWELASDAADLRPKLLQSIADIEAKTCIRFQEKRSSTIKNYLRITIEASGCWSYVGMYKPSSQRLNLQKSGCWYEGIISHELMHAVGFHHEHQRHDRDDYITVKLENTASGTANQFTKYTLTDTVDTGVPYNYQSIMHYDLLAFGRKDNGSYLQTIFPKQSGVTIEHVVYRPELTASDALQVNRIYGTSCQVRSPTDLEDQGGSSGTNDSGSGQNGGSSPNNSKIWATIAYFFRFLSSFLNF